MKQVNKQDVAVRVEKLNKTFKLPHERHSGIKQLLINKLRGKAEIGYEEQRVL